jgi:diguanylate cyclase (GGDEF)-like protein
MVNLFASAGPAFTRIAGAVEASNLSFGELLKSASDPLGLLALSKMASESAAGQGQMDALAGLALRASDMTGAIAQVPGVMPAVLVCGLLIIPLIYDALFYSILKQRFILLHIAMVFAMLLFAVTTPGLGSTLLADFPSAWVKRVNLMSFSLAGSGALLLADYMLERRFHRLYSSKILRGLAILIVLASLLVLLTGWLPDDTDTALYLAVFFVPGIYVFGLLVDAIGRGSRVAGWLLFSMTGAIAAGVVLLFEALGVISWGVNPSGPALVGVVVLAVVTSLAVGDRFVEIQRQRDRALDRASELGQMALTDSLTGLLNRRAFERRRAALSDAEGLLVVDIDRFKQINDTFGHQAGDAVLRHMARTVRQAMTSYGHSEIYRIGGEEFAIICRAERPAQLMTVAEDVREQIASEILSVGDAETLPYTVSLGAVMGRGQEMSLAFAEADSALYGAKAMGRDRSVLYRHNPAAEIAEEAQDASPAAE